MFHNIPCLDTFSPTQTSFMSSPLQLNKTEKGQISQPVQAVNYRVDLIGQDWTRIVNKSVHQEQPVSNREILTE